MPLVSMIPGGNKSLSTTEIVRHTQFLNNHLPIHTTMHKLNFDLHLNQPLSGDIQEHFI